jgi:undecaprenyl-diphosphatase
MATSRPGQNDPEQSPKPVALISAVLVASLVAAVGALVLFAWLAEEMSRGATASFDNRVRMWVHGLASPSVTTVTRCITELGSPGLFAAFVVALLVFLIKGWNRGAMWLVLSMAGATVLELALKHAFHRARPVAFFGVAPHSYSFPSGHSLFSFCFYGTLAGLINARVRSWWLRVVVWVAAALMVFAIGLSRIYLGVHYPSDVLAGYLAALMWVSALVIADRLHKTRRGLEMTTVADEEKRE